MESPAISRPSSAPPSSFNNRQRQRPASRIMPTSYSYDTRPYDSLIQRHHRASSSSSALPTTGQRIFPQRTLSAMASSSLPVSDPRLSTSGSLFHLATIGPSFSTPSESLLPAFESVSTAPNEQAHEDRSSSPTPTVDFSIIDVDTDDSDANPSIPGSYPSRFLSSSMSFPRGRSIYAGHRYNGSSHSTRGLEHQTAHSSSISFKSLLPRLWDALSSPARTLLNFSNVNATSPPQSPSSSRTPSPSAMPRRRPNQSWYTPNAGSVGRNSSAYWHPPASSNKAKGKSKAVYFFPVRSGSRSDFSEPINYSELPPLDGEEGELIDDEACFIDVRAVHGIGR